MNPKNFGVFIQSRRKALGLTQAELAEMLHVTDKAVSRWERGVGFPEITMLEPLARALEITLVELMQSRMQESDILSATEAEAAVAVALELAQCEKKSIYRFPLWWGSYLGICGVMTFFIATLTWFVDQIWIRSLGVYLTISCGSLAMTAVRRTILRRIHPDLAPLSLKELVGIAALFIGGLLLIFSFPIRSRFGSLACDLCRMLGFLLMGMWVPLYINCKKDFQE